MSTSEKNKSEAAHVSLFPTPPWQLINKHINNDQPIRPPTPPDSSVYRMFGNIYNADDAMLRSLESQGVRRVYPQIYNRKRELRKINFSILANYLDLLDIITRDPSSARRVDWLDHLAVLFINMHHLVNEYRQHQARDLLREILRYQVSIASQTVEKADQYIACADEILRNAGNDLVLPNQSSMVASSSLPISTSCIDTVRSGLVDLGPTLSPLLQTVLDETMGSDTTTRRPVTVAHRVGVPVSPGINWDTSVGEFQASTKFDYSEHLDPTLWQFLNQSRTGDSNVEF